MRHIVKMIKKFLNLNFYESPLDIFLSDFDKTHPRLSEAQQAEKEKYDRISRLRDIKITE